MQVQVIKEKRNNVEITVRDTKVFVFAPQKMPVEDIRKLVDYKYDWIQNRLRSQNKGSNAYERKSIPKKNVDNRSTTNYNMQYSFREVLIDGKVFEVKYYNGKKCHYRDGIIYTGADSYEKRRNDIGKLLISLCQDNLPNVAANIYAGMNVCPQQIGLAQTKRTLKPSLSERLCANGLTIGQWVSVDNYVVKLDMQLIQLPEILQRYVITSAGAILKCGSFSENYFYILKRFNINASEAENHLAKYSYLKELFM